MQKTRRINTKQAILDGYIKKHYCTWCGKEFSNPSSLSIHRQNCTKRPIEYDIESSIKTYNSGIKQLTKIINMLTSKVKTNEIDTKKLSQFNSVYRYSVIALEKAYELGGITKKEYDNMNKKLAELHNQYISILFDATKEISDNDEYRKFISSQKPTYIA